MNGKQHAVLWLGLILIVVRIGPSGQWSAIWRMISSGSIINFHGSNGSSPAAGLGNSLPNAPGSPGGIIKLLPNGIPIVNPAKIPGLLKNVSNLGPSIGPANGGITPGTNLGNPAAGIGAP